MHPAEHSALRTRFVVLLNAVALLSRSFVTQGSNWGLITFVCKMTVNEIRSFTGSDKFF
jgi:hypothetical protein